MRDRVQRAVVIGLLLAGCAEITSAADGRTVGAAPAVVGASRTAALQNLWDAYSQFGLAAAAVASDDVPAARTDMVAARGALAREARRARHGARQVLSKQEASAYRHGLLTLLRRVMTVSRRLRTRQRRAPRPRRLEAGLTPATP